MALTNAQHEAIIHKYDLNRMRNRAVLEERRMYVYNHVAGYKALEDSTVNISIDMAHKRFEGDDDAMKDLHDILEGIKEKKKSLLKSCGLSESFLDPVYDCPDCKDTGYIGQEKCHCFKKQIIDLLYAQSNILEYINDNNFSTLSFDYREGESLELLKTAVSKCRNFVNDFDRKSDNILLYGTVGTGKSFLSGCVAKELIEKGHSVIYFSAIDLFNEIARETFENKSKEDLYNLYDYIYNCDLLIIDDLGTEVTNSFISTQLFACINERLLRKKSTIISTNLELSELRDRYSDRTFSRIVSSYTVCKLSGPDIRIMKKTM
ncbi:MAG: ATP-binding protein [Lachnospiraceae bacterium]|nr:ATP-binding protein [Lachnospiraceae bacterium]